MDPGFDPETPGIPRLAVIIPTLNAAQTLPACLDGLRDLSAMDGPLVVVDGGSRDGTAEIARSYSGPCPCYWLDSACGRGRQLAAGASWVLEQGGQGHAPLWLLFLHADSRLRPGWRQGVESHMQTVPSGAAYFPLAFHDLSPEEQSSARRVCALANWRSRRLALPYGDQGLLIPASLYQAVGGYADMPLMEDVNLMRRLARLHRASEGRARGKHAGGKRARGARPHLSCLPDVLTTSAERFRRGGWWGRPLKNLCCLALFFAGIPVSWIAAWYRR